LVFLVYFPFPHNQKPVEQKIGAGRENKEKTKRKGIKTQNKNNANRIYFYLSCVFYSFLLLTTSFPACQEK